MDRRFDVVDVRFGEMLGHLDEIYRRLERLEQEYHVIPEQLRRIETTVTDESGRRAPLERDLAALEAHRRAAGSPRRDRAPPGSLSRGYRAGRGRGACRIVSSSSEVPRRRSSVIRAASRAVPTVRGVMRSSSSVFSILCSTEPKR